MQDGDTKDKAVLDLKDLARLFGFLRTNDDGDIISVEPDYDDDDAGSAEEGGSGSGGYMDDLDL